MKKNLIKYLFILCILFISLSLIIFDQLSFWFLGIGIVVIGSLILYLVNQKKDD